MNRLLKIALIGMVAALCAVSAFANVPPIRDGLRGEGVLLTRRHEDTKVGFCAGNLISRRDAEGAETEYSYDRMNRIDRIEYPDNSVVGFTYDPAGNMLSATNSDAAVSFGYDPMNRVSSVISSVFSVLSVVNYSHDKNGNRTGLTLPGNKTITYTYDDVNRLETLDLSTFGVSTFDFSYDDANRLTNITYPNGVTAAYTYDEGGRLTGLTYAKSGTAFIDRAYTYNALGQITKRTITAGLEAVPPDTHQRLRHNAADQMTHVSRMDNYETPEQWRDVGPAYNANGAVTNITARYNGMTLDSAFTWDYEGRLKSYSGEHQTNLWFVAPPIPSSLAFKYDALGGRIARTGPSGGEKIHVLDQAAELKNVLVERAADGTIERYYIYAPGFGLVAHIDANGTARYYHGDHLGSTIALTDASGNVTDQFNYTPYGELMARTGSTDTPYTFCGRHGVYWEGGALYHMKARYYRADIARFISPDPLGIAGGVNLYAYANGDPIRFLDALGLCAQKSDWTIIKDNYVRMGEHNKQGPAIGAVPNPMLVMQAVQQIFEGTSFAPKPELMEHIIIGALPSPGFLIGKGYPTKLNRSGALQPYDPATGRYLSTVANPGTVMSPAGRFSAGFAQGWAESKGAAGSTPVGTAGNIGYALGNLLGSLL
jgi:RHS repeat-associated protein